MSAAVLGGVVVSVGLLCWLIWSTLGSSSAPSMKSAPAAIPESRPTSETRPRIEVPEAPVVPVRALEPAVADAPEAKAPESGAAPVAVPHVEREGRHERKYVPNEFFEERYANATLAELRAKKEELQDSVAAGMNKALTDYLDAGRGQVEIKPRAASLDEAMAASKPLPSDGLTHTQRANVTPDGMLHVESGALPWEENTPLYDSQDEMFWLTGAIDKKKASMAAGAAGTGK